MLSQRQLGRSGPMVSEVGLGCVGLSGFYGPAREREALATLHEALDRGVTLFDTADCYGDGANERLVGRALRGRRDQAIVATKFGQAGGDEGIAVHGDRAYVRAACERSLRRLGVDSIDIYLQHRVDRSVPIEETVGAMAELVQEGKVRWLGLCEASPDTIRRAASVHPIAVVQHEYSLWERGVEASVLPALRERGIGLMAYAPLGRGFLAGAVRSHGELADGDVRREHFPRFAPGNLERNLRLLEALESLARKRGVKPAQLSLAWLLARGRDVVPIPGTKRRSRLRVNLAAADLELSGSDLAELERTFSPGAAAGARYAPDHAELVEASTPAPGATAAPRASRGD